MKLDRTLIDREGAPTVKETQEYFKKNDYTTAPLPFDSATGKDKDVIIYMKARELFKKVWFKNQKQLGGKASFVNFTKKRENERNIEQTERRIATELDELANRMQSLWITVFVTIGSSIALSAIVWIILFTLLR